MKDMVKKVLYFDKTILVLTVLSLIAIVTIIVTSIYANETKAGNDSLRRQLKEINTLADGVIDIKGFVESKERKIGLRKTRGVVSTMQQTLKSLGLKAKTIKPDERKTCSMFSVADATVVATLAFTFSITDTACILDWVRLSI